jgi:8-oxo-dGTP pyrophosphatase MutT (NUDIX family)
MSAPRLKALVWVVRPGRAGPEVLLLERPRQRGGGEHPVTGKADPGESAIAAAVREAHEETGLSGPLVDLDYQHAFVDARGRDQREHAFLMVAQPGADVTLSSEHVGARWVSGDEARAAVSWPAHRASLDRALAAFPG